MKTKTLIISSILLLVVVLSACAPRSAQPTQGIRSLYINGNGTAEVKPDIAYISIGVHTEAEEAIAAVNMNNSRAQKVMSALKEFGVEDKDLRTTNFSISSLQKTNPETGQVIGVYYVVDNNIIVTVRDLPKLGSLLDEAVQAGANAINNIQFDLEDSQAALQEARQEAMQNAMDQAKEMAEAAGFSLGEIQNINYSESVPMFYSNFSAYDYGKGGGGDRLPADFSVSVNPGQMTITATVSMTYAIK